LADDIGISRSRLSHILTGRNNPSLEIIQSLLNRFPEINPDWLLFGKEPIFRGTLSDPEKIMSQPNLFDKPDEIAEEDTKPIKTNKEKSIDRLEFQDLPDLEAKQESSLPKVKMITVFYENNEYEIFYPDKGN